MMRQPLLLALLVAALAGGAAGLGGCSTTDSRSDAERIVGVRTAAAINARVLGVSVPVRDVETTTPPSQVSFASGGAFSLRLGLGGSITVGPDGNQVTIPLPDAVSIAGTYSLDEADDRVTIARTDVGGTLTLRYVFRGADDLELIAEDAAAIEVLLGLAGPDAQQLAGVVQGVSVRFNQ